MALACLASGSEVRAAAPKQAVTTPEKVFDSRLLEELHAMATVAVRTTRPRGVPAYRRAQGHLYFTVNLAPPDILFDAIRGNLHVAHATALPYGIALSYQWDHPGKFKPRHEHRLVRWKDIVRLRHLCQKRSPGRGPCGAYQSWKTRTSAKRTRTKRSTWVRTDTMRHTPRLAGGRLFVLGTRLVYEGRNASWSLLLPTGHALVEVSPIRPSLLLLTTNSYQGVHDGELGFPYQSTQVFLIRLPQAKN